MLGGVERTLGPLTFRTLRKIAPRFGELAKLGSKPADGQIVLPNDDQLNLILEIVHASISRNHPEVTLDQLEDLLDTSNMLNVFIAILRGSGLEQRIPGE